MKKNRKLPAVLGMGVVKLILLVYAVIVIFPMVWCIMSSLKTTKEFYADVWALPSSLYIQNFKKKKEAKKYLILQKAVGYLPNFFILLKQEK